MVRRTKYGGSCATHHGEIEEITDDQRSGIDYRKIGGSDCRSEVSPFWAHLNLRHLRLHFPSVLSAPSADAFHPRHLRIQRSRATRDLSVSAIDRIRSASRPLAVAASRSISAAIVPS